jgi:hypothetical protein
MRTAVIDASEASKYSGSNSSVTAAASSPGLADVGKYDPACFRMPIPNLNAGEIVEMTVSYFETLDYVDSQYVVSVPLAFDSASLVGRRIENVMDVRCTINAGCP